MSNYMSFFSAPISPYTDEHGVRHQSSMRPLKSVTVEEVHRMILYDQNLKSTTEKVREAEDFRSAKSRMLPFITPFGTFSYRRSTHIKALSGLIPLDIDGLNSEEEAQEFRDEVFTNNFVRPQLAFVSPSGRGVKVFVPYQIGGEKRLPSLDWISETQEALNEYIETWWGFSAKAKLDHSGRDIVRACFLCHDPGVKFRET